jgi:hypothetical protein
MQTIINWLGMVTVRVGQKKDKGKIKGSEPFIPETCFKAKDLIMGTREVIKNLLREKLQEFSKEELIEMTSELASNYVIVRGLGIVAAAMNPSESSELKSDISNIINATASKIASSEISNQQVCKVNANLFKK